MSTAQDLQSIIFGYTPPPVTVRGQPSLTAGGCSVVVSAAALSAIRALASRQDGRLPQSAGVVLARIDAYEQQSTDLGVLLRALGRRDVYVRGVTTLSTPPAQHDSRDGASKND